MSTIKAILESDSDGTLHLPVPVELRRGRVEVTATLRPAGGATPVIRQATPEKVALRKAALQQLRSLGGLVDVVPDPLAWQRHTRQDRPLPGRE